MGDASRDLQNSATISTDWKMHKTMGLDEN